MKTQFYLILSLKTPKGFADYGEYFIGSERDAACALFHQLKGNSIPEEQAVLYFDLVEMENEVPVNIKTKSCTLEELGWNCKQITREMFRLRNIKEEA